MICSPYKITFLGEVLLDFDEEVDTLPSFPASGEIQAVTFAGAAEASVFGRGGRIEALNWVRLKNWSSHHEAAVKAISGRSAMRVGVVGVLNIQVKDGGEFEFSNFALESVEHSPAQHWGYHVRESYSGQGTGLTVINNGGF